MTTFAVNATTGQFVAGVEAWSNGGTWNSMSYANTSAAVYGNCADWCMQAG